MGSVCNNKVSVSSGEPILQPFPRSKTLTISLEELRQRRQLIFTTEESEISFMNLSTPNTGRAIRYRQGDLIGEGAYAKVFQCLNLQTGELMAVKHFTVTPTQLTDEPKKIEKVFLNMRKEVSLLKNLSHPNIVRYYQTDLSEDMQSINVLLEFVPGGSLKFLLSRYGALEINVVKTYARQLLNGLEYLHANHVVHRDLKAANILITSEGILKVADFGSSRKFEALDHGMSKSLRGSPYWMAPEVVKRQGHSYPADIWSFGCVLIEMVTGRPPWSNYSKDIKEVLEIISMENALPDMPDCEETLLQVIKICLQRDPTSRPTCVELKSMRFFY
jgi:mitogen-activated protein kinase kinase kinase ANP1